MCSRTPTAVSAKEPVAASRMIPAGRSAKILLIDQQSNYTKRLGDALNSADFERVRTSTQPVALTTRANTTRRRLSAILCADKLCRENGRLEKLQGSFTRLKELQSAVYRAWRWKQRAL